MQWCRSGGEAAIDEQRLAGDKIGRTAREKNRATNEIRRLRETAKFDAVQQPLAAFWIGRDHGLNGTGHRRRWGERVDSNAERRPFRRQRRGEMRDGGLGG